MGEDSVQGSCLTETESSTLFMFAALVTSHTDVPILHSYVHFYSSLWRFCLFAIFSSTAAEISLHEFCTIWESLRSCIHVSHICPYRQPCLKLVNFLNSWGCNSKHPKLRKLKRCTAGQKNAKKRHALLEVTSLLSSGENSEHERALR